MSRLLSSTVDDPKGRFALIRSQSWRERWPHLYLSDPDEELQSWGWIIVEELSGRFVIQTFERFSGYWNGVNEYRYRESATGTTGGVTALYHNIPPVEVLESTVVEGRGPFRFVAAECLEDHLTFTSDYRIRIYKQWQEYHWMVKSRLFNAEYARHGTSHSAFFHHLEWDATIEKYGFVGTWNLGMDLAKIHYLLVYRCAVSKPIRYSFYKVPLIGQLLSDYVSTSRSQRIASRLGCMPMIGGRDGQDSWESYNRFLFPQARLGPVTEVTSAIFRQRLLNLNSHLSDWKPQTVGQLRHVGYGDADPISLYGFYAAIMFGIVSLIGVVLAALQVYIGWRSVSQGNSGTSI